MSILTTLITEHWDDITAAAVIVGGWLFHKARGDKTKTVREILDDVVDQVLVSEGVDLENVKARAEAACSAALAKAGIKGKTADALVHEFVEYAAGELARRFDLLQRNFDLMFKAVEKAGKTVEAAK